MSPDDVRLTAQLVAAGRVFSVSDASLMAMARRVLELEELLERHAFVGKGDPVEWSPVPDDVVLAVCVDYREKVTKALESWMSGAEPWIGWHDAVLGVRMLGRQVSALDVVTEVAAEREACALVCFDVAAGTGQTARKVAAQDCGVLIRARGAK